MRRDLQVKFTGTTVDSFVAPSFPATNETSCDKIKKAEIYNLLEQFQRCHIYVAPPNNFSLEESIYEFYIFTNEIILISDAILSVSGLQPRMFSKKLIVAVQYLSYVLMTAWNLLSAGNSYTFCSGNDHPCFLSDPSQVVTWYDAVNWCDSKSDRTTGVTYRLPAVISLDIKTKLESSIAYFDLFGQNVWIGTYRNNTSQWTWVNDTQLDSSKSQSYGYNVNHAYHA